MKYKNVTPKINPGIAPKIGIRLPPQRLTPPKTITTIAIAIKRNRSQRDDAIYLFLRPLQVDIRLAFDNKPRIRALFIRLVFPLGFARFLAFSPLRLRLYRWAIKAIKHFQDAANTHWLSPAPLALERA